MRKISYDFSTLENIFDGALARGDLKASDLSVIKRELNKFFKDSQCMQVYYTENTDKMFFGIIVNASIDADNIYEYLMGTKDIRISRYNLEYDSHLFNPTLGMTAREIMALTLHEIGHVVNDMTPIQHARQYLDEYLAKTGESVPMSQSYNYRDILAYALKDFIAKDRSAFYTRDTDEILADDFARSYGYGPALESAMGKIIAKNSKLYTGTDVDKFAVFTWTLGIYRHLGTRRIPAIRAINKAKALTGSRIEKMEMDNVLRRIVRIDDHVLIEGTSDGGLVNKIKSRMRKMRYDTMRSLEDDFYEFNMRIRNVEDEDDALYLMRQLNTRISLIEDYVNSEDLSPTEAKRWNESLEKFKRIRDDLSSTLVYKGKSYGLFIPYPDIKPDNY